MLRRISTFRSSRKEKENGVKVNGVNGTNGTPKANGGKALTNGTAAVHEETHHEEHHDPHAQSLLEQYAQLVHASMRPLPTQSGDGAYLDHEVPSGLFSDIKSLGFKDVKTLMQVMQNKGKLQDDKTYLMERVIQVRFMCQVK
jgi:linoleate 10R-lipoxygenase